MLLPYCVPFSCCFPIASALQLLLPDFVHPLRDCCSPFPSDTAAAPLLRPLQLLFPDFNSSPDCVRFDCCFPIASACSLTCSGRFQPNPNVLKHSFAAQLRFSKLKYEGRASLVQSRPTNIPLPSHTDTHTHAH